MMVNTQEKWIDPEEYEYMVKAIRQSGYKIKTTMANLIRTIYLSVDKAIEDGTDILRDCPVDIMYWVQESGGLEEFDYVL